MQEFNITNEDPIVHWPDINVKNKNVLDLGCGRWDATEQSKTTPIYFLDQGAKNVIGIDSSSAEVEYYQSLNLSNAKFFAESIQNSLLLKKIINENDINVIKSDIEGAEIIFLDFTQDDLKNVSSLYIEYHGHHIKNLLIPKIKNLGFIITKIGHLWIDGYGVLFCEKEVENI